MMTSTQVDKGPIFIGGLAHSGKTPLRRMLSCHPRIAMTRRTYMWNRFYDRFGELSERHNFERCLAAMLEIDGIRALKPDPERIRREFARGAKTYARLFALFHEHHAESLGKRRWGDQLGFVEHFADTILTAYRSARMIHMMRDPRDSYSVAMSTSRYRRGKVGWSTARWLYSAKLAQCNLDRYPERYKVVRYETLMTRTEETLRAICDFLGEDFTTEMIEAVTVECEKKVNGWHAVPTDARTRMSSRRISRGELAFTQGYAHHYMLQLDYPLDPLNLSLLDRLLFYFVDWPTNRAGMIAWRTLNSSSTINSLRET